MAAIVFDIYFFSFYFYYFHFPCPFSVYFSRYFFLSFFHFSVHSFPIKGHNQSIGLSKLHSSDIYCLSERTNEPTSQRARSLADTPFWPTTSSPPLLSHWFTRSLGQRRWLVSIITSPIAYEIIIIEIKYSNKSEERATWVVNGAITYKSQPVSQSASQVSSKQSIAIAATSKLLCNTKNAATKLTSCKVNEKENENGNGKEKKKRRRVAWAWVRWRKNMEKLRFVWLPAWFA